jgi:hypothetical protein
MIRRLVQTWDIPRKKYNPNMKKQIRSEIGVQTKFGPVIHLYICVYINKWYVCMDKLLHLYLIDSIYIYIHICVCVCICAWIICLTVDVIIQHLFVYCVYVCFDLWIRWYISIYEYIHICNRICLGN